MRNILLSFPALIIILFFSCQGNQPNSAEILDAIQVREIPEGSTAYRFDSQSSQVNWTGSKVTGKHYGTIGLEEGRIYIYQGRPVGGNVVINMEQIIVQDISDPNINNRLKKHLESDDFFSVARYPRATFEFLSFEKLPSPDENGNNYKITGNLTIKDITHAIALNARLDYDDYHINARADLNLDRTLWDIKFRSGRFFENLGDNLIHDIFNINLIINANPELAAGY
jgi:polyisoprenoid-binding protein YceI